jgi:glycosyltransferase involved in cell wall biosynthesis
LKILFICPYPLQKAPSQRFRFEQYLNQLSAAGFAITVSPFFNGSVYNSLHTANSRRSKIIPILESFIRRFALLFRVSEYDFVFIHREAAPVGPPVIEWAIAKLFKKKIIYDFDDAIWTTDKTSEPAIEKLLRWRIKVKSICLWSYKVSCGNAYLASYALVFNANTIVNPTTIDLAATNGVWRKAPHRPLTIGWTGSSSTLKYLEEFEPVLLAIENEFPSVYFVFIADRRPKLRLQNMIFKYWNVDSELQDLAEIDIGIMPLPDDEWTKGKCGFKALQYMSLEIPAVVSAVGVNSLLIQNNQNGFICHSNEEWLKALRILILDETLRKRIGKAGKKTVQDHYSVESNSENFLSFFQ